jgi:hypothetical protein
MKTIMLSLVTLVGITTTSQAAMFAQFNLPDTGSSLALLALGVVGLAVLKSRIGRK